jgi:hypothetical protein
MKSFICALLVSTVAFSLTCCVSAGYTEYTIPVTSEAMHGGNSSNNPSLSTPSKGMHPYVGLEYADKQNYDTSSETVEKYQAMGVTSGLILQPELAQDKVLAPFMNCCLNASVVDYKIDLNKDTKNQLALLHMDYLTSNKDIKLEGIIRPGFLVKSNDFLFSVFLQGIVKYEYGEFSYFRSELDNKANIYNLKKNNITSGFGYGFDAQRGIIGKYDVGCVLNMDVLFNRTQSLPYSDQNVSISSVELMENGDPYREIVYKIEPYVDYKNMRASFSATDKHKYCFQISYKF